MDKNLRILIMAPDQLLTRAGGLRTQVERTAEELQRQGHYVDYFNPWKSYDFESFDICHIFSMNSPTFFKFLLVNGKLPIVFSSVMWREGNRKFIRALVELFLKSPFSILNDVIACRKMSLDANLILPNTHQEKDWLCDAIGVDITKCVVVPNGADDHFSASTLEDLRRDSAIDVEGEFVFCCSVISSRKNLKRLANVCVRNSLPLVIAGPIVDQDIAEYLKKVDAGRNIIRLVGKLENNSNELGFLYKACRVFCLPSFYETPGISALEAGLCNANIVVTRIGGADDYFDDTARYVDPYSEVDLEKKLLDAWQNGPPVSDKCLPDLLRSEFSWSSVAAKTGAAYVRALSK